ncbi:MAG: dihydrodipicolinate synthase family protein [Proteobacteria bacterium]|nr:dihydrodipicolinate synthase family protein [Pseudomonadota bacterium]
MSRRCIEGSFVALITPFNEDGSIDYGAFRTLLDFQQRHGTRAILFMGSTVEARGDLAVRAVPDRGEGPHGGSRGTGSRRGATWLRSCPPPPGAGAPGGSSFTSLRHVAPHLDQRRCCGERGTVQPFGGRDTHLPSHQPLYPTKHGGGADARSGLPVERGKGGAAGRERARRRGTRAEPAARCARPGTTPVRSPAPAPSGTGSARPMTARRSARARTSNRGCRPLSAR